MMKKAFQKESQKSESEVNGSENPSDFGFAKNCLILTTFGFEFKLRHIPSGTGDGKDIQPVKTCVTYSQRFS